MYESLIQLFPVFKDFWVHYFIDNSMFKIVLTFIPGMLSLAYPLIIQSIGKLNDQYSSSHITNQFKKEKLHKYFLWNLRLSVLLTIFGFTLSVLIFIIAFISIISLLIIFFLYLRILLKYQSGQDLFELYLKKLEFDCKRIKVDSMNNERVVDYFKPINKVLNLITYFIKKSWLSINNFIIKRYISRKKSKILKYWHSMIDLYIYSIKNKNRRLETDIRELFLYKAFNFIKNCDQREKEEVEFPPAMYNSMYDIISAYIKNDEPDYYQNYELFVAKVFYSESFSEKPEQYIHPNSMAAIWRNLILLIEHQQNDKIIEYWKWAHQYFSWELKIPESEFNSAWEQTEESLKKQKQVRQHRDTFIQFHILIGAYLLYKKNYIALRKIWFFTQSQPPIYYLFPQTPGEIFNYFSRYLYYELSDSDLLIFSFKSLDYYEFNNERSVRSVVAEYLVLLFMRLYLLPQYYYGMDALSHTPPIPINQQAKMRMGESMNIFIKKLENINSNMTLLKNLDLDKITKELCKERNIKCPLEYVTEYRDNLKSDFNTTVENAPLDKNKTSSLESKAVASIKSVHNDLLRIKGKDVGKLDRDFMSNHLQTIRGTSILLDREAFIEDPTIHNLNADSIIGEIISKNYYNHFAVKISQQKKKLSLIVKNGELFSAITKLNPSEDYSIINFGINLEYFRSYKDVLITEPTGNEDFRFSSLPIYNFNGWPHVGNKLYLIKNEFLPMIKHKDYTEIDNLPPENKGYWKSLTKIDESLKIYSKFTEMNDEPKRKEYYIKQGKREEELKNKIEITIDFIGYCWFNKETEVIELNESSLFKEGGIINEIDDIKPL